MSASVRSLNIGVPEPAAWAALQRTAIRKSVVAGPLRATRLGLEGDQVADLRHHGGEDKALYAFAREDLDFWEGVLGRPIGDGQFGENLTTTGIDVNEALVGERWRVGTALVEVSEPRIPCSDFKNWMGASGYDPTAWVKRFTAEGRPGPYLRVVEEGIVAAGDPLVVEHRPAHGVTLTSYFQACTTRKSELAAVEAAIAAG
jgi:MOSC domain-containing protein YiiM